MSSAASAFGGENIFPTLPFISGANGEDLEKQENAELLKQFTASVSHKVIKENEPDIAGGDY